MVAEALSSYVPQEHSRLNGREAIYTGPRLQDPVAFTAGHLLAEDPRFPFHVTGNGSQTQIYALSSQRHHLENILGTARASGLRKAMSGAADFTNPGQPRIVHPHEIRQTADEINMTLTEDPDPFFRGNVETTYWNSNIQRLLLAKKLVGEDKFREQGGEDVLIESQLRKARISNKGYFSLSQENIEDVLRGVINDYAKLGRL